MSRADLIAELGALAHREHYDCEDTWYNCPAYRDAWASSLVLDALPGECNCGADAHNAKVAALLNQLSEAPRCTDPTASAASGL